MKIASFTQTYGNDRLLELLLTKYDKVGNYFRFKCDYIIFSFHNVSEDIKKKVKPYLEEMYPHKLIILEWDNISYRQTLKNLITILENLKVDYIFELQDDQFGINNKDNYKFLPKVDLIFKFLAKAKPNYLNLYDTEGDSDKHNLIIDQINQVTDSLNSLSFYKYPTYQYETQNMFSFNFGVYMCKLSFYKHLVYLNHEKDDPWHMEVFIKRYFDQQPLFRWGIKQRLFFASNIHGVNKSQLPLMDNLKQFFEGVDRWADFPQLFKDFL